MSTRKGFTPLLIFLAGAAGFVSVAEARGADFFGDGDSKFSAKPGRDQKKKKSLFRTSNEPASWYTYWGIGYPVINYPASLQPQIDHNASLAKSHLPLTADFFGIYFPLPNWHTLAGVVLNCVWDSYTATATSSRITQLTAGASFLHFFEDRVGEGFYARLDAGTSWAYATHSEGKSVTSEMGMGGLLGLGYAIPAGENSHLLLGAGYGIRRIQGELYKTASLTIGGLF